MICSVLNIKYRFVYLLLLTSERAWAQAMHMKSTNSADGAKSITSSTRQHIGTRLHKASVYSAHLITLLQDQPASKASTEDILEARAYHVSLVGANSFEKQKWMACLHSYSEAHLIYTSLAQIRGSKQDDEFRDLLNTTIDPSIRYAAYQLNLSRTTTIDTIVSKYILRDDNNFIKELLKLNPRALDSQASTQEKSLQGNIESVPQTIQWRSRTVNLEDATTAQALGTVAAAERDLVSFLTSNPDATSQAKGAAYDQVLISSQDAVDATKTALDELTSEGVSPGDPRMQSLQITKTAVNYALVGWRIGRNRVLCGKQDGALSEAETPRRPERPTHSSKRRTTQEESVGRKLTRFKERVVLYDSTLQSLDSIKTLPGVAADQEFLKELERKRSFFAALRCLVIARSHALLHNAKNALALLSRALDLTSVSQRSSPLQKESPERPPNIDVLPGQVRALHDLLQGLVFQYRALVELHDHEAANTSGDTAGHEPPLVERLDEYPPGPLDLTNLVTYPPRVEPIPVKPIFLDVAFNHIDYPGRTHQDGKTSVNGLVDGQAGREEKKEAKKGWFGFGR